MHFMELGLPSSQALFHLMHPSDRAGSLKRFVVRVVSADQKYYYLVKEVGADFGENEIIIGRVLRKIFPEQDVLVPAIGGAKAPGTDTEESVFVVVPWKLHTIPLNTFIQDRYPERLGLTTESILRAIYPLVVAFDATYTRARFLHLDCKANQILVSQTLPLKIYLADFGHSSIKVTVDGEHIDIRPCTISATTKTFQEEVSSCLTMVHELVAASSPNKNAKLIRQWNGEKRRFRNLASPIKTLIAWFRTTFPDLGPAVPEAPLHPNTTATTAATNTTTTSTSTTSTTSTSSTSTHQ
eukprot:Phypoly_transcript_10800.p1 GENE.Phypoly_transcript_10800~~Phypoly_transcript_10800.p1  ORF type:complete len:297 (+),score=26.89 Phypoly_transcript_10800:221-1111(+)